MYRRPVATKERQRRSPGLQLDEIRVFEAVCESHISLRVGQAIAHDSDDKRRGVERGFAWHNAYKHAAS